MSAQQILDRADRSAAKVQKQQRQGQIKFVKEQVGAARNSHLVQALYDFTKKVCVDRIPAAVADAQVSQTLATDGVPPPGSQPGSSTDAPGALAIVPVSAATKAQQEHEESMRKEIIRQYSTVKDAPIKDLKHVLQHVEPVAFAKHALYALRSEHGREIAKAPLFELLEYITGCVSADTKLSGVFETFGAFAEYVARLHCERGRPGVGLKLDEDWGTKGVYTLRVEATGIIIGQKFLEMAIEMPADELTSRGFDLNFDDHALYLDKNFSERRATLCQHGSAANLPLIAWFGAASKRPNSGGDRERAAAQRRRVNPMPAIAYGPLEPVGNILPQLPPAEGNQEAPVQAAVAEPAVEIEQPAEVDSEIPSEHDAAAEREQQAEDE